MSREAFQKIIPTDLNQLDIIPFHHKGEWAIHEALPVLLSMTGPANVMMETFNMSEDALRPIFFLCQENMISNLKLILDTNMKRHKLEILLFAANISPDVHTTACHAKVLLIQNKKYSIGITGSANSNQNARYESGIVFGNKSLFDFFKTKFTEVFENDSMKFE